MQVYEVRRSILSVAMCIMLIGVMFILSGLRPEPLMTEKQVESGLRSGEYTAYLINSDTVTVSEYEIKVAGLVVCDNELRLIAMQDGDSVFISNDQDWYLDRNHLIRLGK